MVVSKAQIFGELRKQAGRLTEAQIRVIPAYLRGTVYSTALGIG